MRWRAPLSPGIGPALRPLSSGAAESTAATNGSIVNWLPWECCPATPRSALGEGDPAAGEPPATRAPDRQQPSRPSPLMHQHESAVGEGEGFRKPLLLRHPPGPVDPGAEKFLLKPRQIGGSALGSRMGVAPARIIKNRCQPTKGRAFPPVVGPGGKHTLGAVIGGSGILPRVGGWHLFSLRELLDS